MEYTKVVNLTAHPVVLLDESGVYQDPKTKSFFVKKESMKVLLLVEPLGGKLPRVMYNEEKQTYSVQGVSLPIESLALASVDGMPDQLDPDTIYIVSGQVAAAVKLPNVVAPSKIVRDADDPKTILGCISFRCES